MRAVRFKISPELLVQALGMPEDITVNWIDARVGLRAGGELEFCVSGPDFEEVAEGAEIPLVTPLLTIDYDNGPREWITWDWRL